MLPLPRFQTPSFVPPLIALLLLCGVEGAAADSTRVETSFGKFVYIPELPEAIKKVDPDYSLIEPGNGRSGTVMLQALVGTDGNVREIKVLKSVLGLDSAAVVAARQWEFTPARMEDGKPVAVWVAVPIHFESWRIVSWFQCRETGDAGDPTRCVWSIVDPYTETVYTFLHASRPPTHVRWGLGFSNVEYILGAAIYRAEWQRDARPVEIARLPVDEGVCDFWYSEEAGYLQLLSVNSGDCIATTWEFHPPAFRWHIVEEQAIENPIGECSCFDMLSHSRGSPVDRHSALLDSMRIHNLPAEVIGKAENSRADDRVYVPSRFSADLGFELDTVFGDSNHALWPVTLVDRALNIRRALLREDGQTDVGFEQIGLREEKGFLLIVDEYSGRNGRLYDTATGDLRFDFGPHSTGAVWVPAPRP